MYVRYYEKVDANEVRAQLLNCLDIDLQLFVYRDLGSNVDTTNQAEMLRVIELLVEETGNRWCLTWTTWCWLTRSKP